MLSNCMYSYVWLLNRYVLLPMPYISYIIGFYLRVVILGQRSATEEFVLSQYLLDRVHHVEISIALFARIFLLCRGPDAQGTFH